MITVIIANHDKRKFLEATLRSALVQEHVVQLVVVDDASSDGSQELIRSLASEDERIQPVFLPENRGQSHCENLGIRHATAPFVVFLDSDDLLDPGCCSHRMARVREFPDFDAWVFPMRTFDDDPSLTTGQWVPRPGNHLAKFLSHRLDWQLMQAVWRRDLLLRSGGFDERFKRMTDIVFHTRALLAGARVNCFPDDAPDCRYRTSPGRLTLSGRVLAERYVASATLFYRSFLPELTGSNRAAIGGTLVAAAELLCTWRARGMIDQAEFAAGARSLRSACRGWRHRACLETMLRFDRVLGFRIPGLRRALVASLAHSG